MGEMRDLYDNMMQRMEGVGLSFIALATLAVLVISVAGIAYIFWAGPTVVWYAAKYRVFTDKVYIDAKPTDCDFWHTPVGFKGCHYERLVWTMGTGGKPEYRYDSKTGQLIDLRTNEEAKEPLRSSEPESSNASYRADSVHVSWTKKSD